MPIPSARGGRMGLLTSHRYGCYALVLATACSKGLNCTMSSCKVYPAVVSCGMVLLNLANLHMCLLVRFISCFQFRFVRLEECDYVLAATYRDYDPRVTRASGVVLEMVKNKEQWKTVNVEKSFEQGTRVYRYRYVFAAGTLELRCHSSKRKIITRI